MNRYADAAIIVFLAAFFLLSARPADADVVKLRKTDIECGGDVPPACFVDDIEGVVDDLHDPQRSGGVPGPNNPIEIDIGPGVFRAPQSLVWYCDGLSHVTFRGVGDGNPEGEPLTVLAGGGAFVDQAQGGPYAMALRDCDRATFEHLMVSSDGGDAVIAAFPEMSDPAERISWSGVRFAGVGTTIWQHMTIFSEGIGWYDEPIPQAGDSVHYWVDAHVYARYAGRQDEFFFNNRTFYWEPAGFFSGALITYNFTRIFDSSIVASEPDSPFGHGMPNMGIEGALYGNGPNFNVILRDSDVIVKTEHDGDELSAIAAGPDCSALPGTGGRLDMSGGSIQAMGQCGASDCQNVTLAALRNNNQRVLVGGTDFSVTGADGIRRVWNQCGSGENTSVLFLGELTNPPTMSPIWSLKGLDVFVETDCSASGCSDTPEGSAQHIMTFDPGCSTGGPWRDEVTGACRSE